MFHYIVGRASNVFDPPRFQAWNRLVLLRCRTKYIYIYILISVKKYLSMLFD